MKLLGNFDDASAVSSLGITICDLGVGGQASRKFAFKIVLIPSLWNGVHANSAALSACERKI